MNKFRKSGPVGSCTGFLPGMYRSDVNVGRHNTYQLTFSDCDFYLKLTDQSVQIKQPRQLCEALYLVSVS